MNDDDVQLIFVKCELARMSKLYELAIKEGRVTNEGYRGNNKSKLFRQVCNLAK